MIFEKSRSKSTLVVHPARTSTLRCQRRCLGGRVLVDSTHVYFALALSTLPPTLIINDTAIFSQPFQSKEIITLAKIYIAIGRTFHMPNLMQKWAKSCSSSFTLESACAHEKFDVWTRPKGHVTRGNLSLQLAMKFLPKKILQVAVRMSDVRNLFCDLQWDYILRPPSI